MLDRRKFLATGLVTTTVAGWTSWAATKADSAGRPVAETTAGRIAASHRIE